jgi:hypothetical protein
MSTRRNNNLKSNKTHKKKPKTGKRWITAITAADNTLKKTGSIKAAKISLKKQALYNARKLFGSLDK